MRLNGAVTLVTGASSGIGAAAARALAAAGARLLITGRDPARLAEVARATGGTALPADLAAPGATADLAEAALAAAAGLWPGGTSVPGGSGTPGRPRGTGVPDGTVPGARDGTGVPGGRGGNGAAGGTGVPGEAVPSARAGTRAPGGIDVLVSNAGLGWAGPIGDVTHGKIAELLAVNLAAPIELTRLLVPGMIERGRGHLVFVSSIAGVTGVRGEAVYAATKAGLGAFAESLGYELREHGVRVSVVVPGVVDTPFFSTRGRPYGRQRPAPVPVEHAARAIVSAIEHDRAIVYVPRWLRLPAWIHGAAPGTFRALAARFGDPG